MGSAPSHFGLATATMLEMGTRVRTYTVATKKSAQAVVETPYQTHG